jgi:hypothetical protein
MEKRLAFGLSECVYIWVYKLHKSGIISFICSQVGNVLRDEGTAGYIFSLASQLRQITLGLHGPWYSSSYCATGKSRESVIDSFPRFMGAGPLLPWAPSLSGPSSDTLPKYSQSKPDI